MARMNLLARVGAPVALALAAAAAFAAPPVDRPRAGDLECAVLAVEVRGRWYCRLEVVNRADRAVVAPRALRRVSVTPRDLTAAKAHSVLLRERLADVRLGPKEGHVRLVPLPGLTLAPADYQLRAALPTAFAPFAPPDAVFTVRERE
jgi:hypothetical protein